MTSNLRRIFVSLITMVFTLVGFTQSTHAAMITAEQAYTSSMAQASRDKLAAALNRPEVIAQLEQMGVSKKDAENRVAALTDEEAAALADRIDSIPAGGDFFAVLGIAIVVLIITDLLGVTHIFPFIRPIR